MRLCVLTLILLNSLLFGGCVSHRIQSPLEVASVSAIKSIKLTNTKQPIWVVRYDQSGVKLEVWMASKNQDRINIIEFKYNKYSGEVSEKIEYSIRLTDNSEWEIVKGLFSSHISAVRKSNVSGKLPLVDGISTTHDGVAGWAGIGVQNAEIIIPNDINVFIHYADLYGIRHEFIEIDQQDVSESHFSRQRFDIGYSLPWIISQNYRANRAN